MLSLQYNEAENLLVPLVNALLIPEPQTRFNLAFALTLLALHLLEQEPGLLSKRVEALPPMRAAMLITVAYENFGKEFVDIVQHCFLVRSSGKESGSCDGR